MSLIILAVGTGKYSVKFTNLDLLLRRRAKRPDPKGTGDLECLIAFLLRGDDADLGEDLDLGDLGDLDLGDLERDFRPPIPVLAAI